jgi:hypothetical protein
MKTLALVVALCASSVAHADTRAWSAAKKVLPSGLQTVLGGNLAQLHASPLFQTLWTTLLAQNKDVGGGVGSVKDACGIDLADVIDSMVVGLDASEHASIIVALRNASRTDAEACLQKLAKGGGQKLTIGKDGALTKYDDGKAAVYLRWLDKTTLAFTSSPDDKDLLTTMTAGGIAKDKAIAPAVAAVKGDAAMLVIMNQAQDLTPLNTKMSLAYGSATLASGKISVDAHLVVENAKAASAAAASANTQLAAAKASGQLPGQVDGLVKSAAIKSAGSEIVITASLPEQDALSLIQLALTK